MSWVLYRPVKLVKDKRLMRYSNDLDLEQKMIYSQLFNNSKNGSPKGFAILGKSKCLSLTRRQNFIRLLKESTGVSVDWA